MACGFSGELRFHRATDSLLAPRDLLRDGRGIRFHDMLLERSETRSGHASPDNRFAKRLSHRASRECWHINVPAARVKGDLQVGRRFIPCQPYNDPHPLFG
jgi:hypothetical protein